jgi:glutathione synthase/RimK-type ligase-like ATP-grasp enzyme
LKFCYSNPRFIIKPVIGSLGKGIRVIDMKDVTDFNALYNELNSGHYVAEEYLTACREISEFNPDSLNTIRVVTYSNGNVFRVIGSFIRMGVKGSNIDNAHAGGVFAHVDVTTGTVTTEGVTTIGDRYVNHPTSGKRILGFQIPVWDKIIDTCRAAAGVIPEARIIGWDIAVANDYRVVIIEGNHMPDFDVMQSTARKGVKKQLMSIVEADMS